MAVRIGYGEVFIIFMTQKEVKVKELVVKPKKGMSYQKHNHRSEIWLVTERIL